MFKPRKTIQFNPPILVNGDWMLGLVDLKVYNFLFNKTEENNKFGLHNLPHEKTGGVSYEKVRDEIEKDLDVSYITAADLQDGIIAPNIIKEYREQVTKRMKDDKYMLILSGYTKSIFQDFESFLRTEVHLVEDDIRVVLDEYNSSFITSKISPGIYTFKDISEAPSRSLQSEYEGRHNAIDIEFDDTTMKTKLVVRPGFIAIRFDEKSFFSSILAFNHGWGLQTL